MAVYTHVCTQSCVHCSTKYFEPDRGRVNETRGVPSWQILKLDWERHELQYPGGCKWGAPGWESYRTVRLGAPANFRILQSKISHETNKQWKSSYKKPLCSLDLRVDDRRVGVDRDGIVS
jgi:hypothetical protein